MGATLGTPAAQVERAGGFTRARPRPRHHRARSSRDFSRGETADGRSRTHAERRLPTVTRSPPRERRLLARVLRDDASTPRAHRAVWW